MTKRILLQPRDLLLFKRLCEFGYLTLPQIEEQVFKAPYKKTSRRLVFLRKKGFIRFVWRRDYVGTRVYIPDLKGLEGTVDHDTYLRGVKSVDQKPWFRSLHEHEDLIRETALKFLNALPLTTVVELDHELKPLDWGHYGDENEARRKVPDFILHVDGMPKIAVENELTAKSTGRYEEIIRHLVRWDLAHFVYLTNSDVVGNKIQSIYTEYTKDLQGGNKHAHKLLIHDVSKTNTTLGILRIIDELKPLEEQKLATNYLNQNLPRKPFLPTESPHKSLTEILRGERNKNRSCEARPSPTSAYLFN